MDFIDQGIDDLVGLSQGQKGSYTFFFNVLCLQDIGVLPCLWIIIYLVVDATKGGHCTEVGWLLDLERLVVSQVIMGHNLAISRGVHIPIARACSSTTADKGVVLDHWKENDEDMKISTTCTQPDFVDYLKKSLWSSCVQIQLLFYLRGADYASVSHMFVFPFLENFFVKFLFMKCRGFSFEFI